MAINLLNGYQFLADIPPSSLEKINGSQIGAAWRPLCQLFWKAVFFFFWKISRTDCRDMLEVAMLLHPARTVFFDDG